MENNRTNSGAVTSLIARYALIDSSGSHLREFLYKPSHKASSPRSRILAVSLLWPLSVPPLGRETVGQPPRKGLVHLPEQLLLCGVQCRRKYHSGLQEMTTI